MSRLAAKLSAGAKAEAINLRFENTLSTEQILIILSRVDLLKNPRVRFELPLCEPMVASDDRKRKLTSHIAEELPTFFIPSEMEDSRIKEALSANSQIKSVSVELSSGRDTLIIRDGLTQNHHLSHLYISYMDRMEWKSCLQEMPNLLNLILPLHPSLQVVVVAFDLDPKSWKQFRKALPNALRSRPQFVRNMRVNRSLYHFSLVNKPTKAIQNRMKNNAAWDCNVSPVLSVNWYKRSAEALTPQEVDEKLLLLKVKEVNNGKVFSRTTNNLPSDQSTANASVIFHMLCQHYGLNPNV
jgi:hypothetical protein